jgi:hypothetical protein
MTSVLPQKYADPEYEKAHRDTFTLPLQQKPVHTVLPPGVRNEDFNQAIQELSAAIGEGSVFVGEALSDYVDPYDLWPDIEAKRKVPSAAVW